MLPEVVIHNMVSLDGRMDWLNVDVGLYYELALRLGYDAVLSGSETMMAGTEGLGEEGWQEMENTEPLNAEFARHALIIVDSGGRMQQVHRMRRTAYWGDTLVLCSQNTPKTYLAYLEEHGMKSIIAGAEKVDLRKALVELKSRFSIERIRVDSGGVLNGVLLRAGLVDEVSVLVAPVLVGGESPRSVFVAPDLRSEIGLIPLRLVGWEEFPGGNIWLRYIVEHK